VDQQTLRWLGLFATSKKVRKNCAPPTTECCATARRTKADQRFRFMSYGPVP